MAALIRRSRLLIPLFALVVTLLVSSAWGQGTPVTSIDTAVENGRGKACFFKGSRYVHFDIAADKVDSGYPKPIDQRNWGGVPWAGGFGAVVHNGKGRNLLLQGRSACTFRPGDRPDFFHWKGLAKSE